MVSLRNALAVFITGDSASSSFAEKKKRKIRQENVSGRYMLDHSRSSEGIRICRVSSSTFLTRRQAKSVPWRCNSVLNFLMKNQRNPLR